MGTVLEVWGVAGDSKSAQSCERASKCMVRTVMIKDIKFPEANFPFLNSSLKECMFKIIQNCKTIIALYRTTGSESMLCYL